jgi:hypothetical protein
MKLARIFLAICGFVYCALGALCAASHMSVANAMGYALPNTTSQAEFVVVYGGLEIGVGLFLLLAASRESFVKAALYFVAILHLSLVVARLATIAVFSDFDPVIYNLLSVESFLAVSSAYIVFRTKNAIT